ncbi:MAG: ATP-binding cassette domain-containing protein [Proteobacteria bacterium]|nr:ATP-binding cassette domain-containing protein [Pseudomonadota bacterium]
MPDNIIEIRGLKNYLGGQWVHSDVNLDVKKGEILAIIGGSGSGKTTILRSLLMLMKPTAGSLKIFGEEITNISPEKANGIRRRWGMMFQHSALFSSMTVIENIMFPMKEFAHLESRFMEELALLKLSQVGLAKEAAAKYPSELSGGMQRRAAAARALAMDPELLFLDEPTTGLDPRSARQFDKLILFLRETLGLTIVMVSHDPESLKITDRIAFIGEGKVLCEAPYKEIKKNKHPLIAEYFSNF